jgi:hypothetical protein
VSGEVLGQRLEDIDQAQRVDAQAFKALVEIDLLAFKARHRAYFRTQPLRKSECRQLFRDRRRGQHRWLRDDRLECRDVVVGRGLDTVGVDALEHLLVSVEVVRGDGFGLLQQAHQDGLLRDVGFAKGINDFFRQ